MEKQYRSHVCTSLTEGYRTIVENDIEATSATAEEQIEGLYLEDISSGQIRSFSNGKGVCKAFRSGT